MGLTMEQLRTDLKYTVNHLLTQSVSEDYVSQVEDAIFEDVLWDVWECSGVRDGENYSDDDVRMAIGRVLLKRFSLCAETFCEDCEHSMDRFGAYLRCVRNGFNAGFEVNPKHFCKHGTPKQKGAGDANG